MAILVLFPVAAAAAQQPSTITVRLATAKVAETSGNFAEAEQQLKKALDEASAAERPQAVNALCAFLVRLGRADEAAAVRGAPAAKAQGGEDPVQRLIAVLDTGSRSKETSEVATAFRELKSLGNLAIPQLIAALPRLGPFGFRNVLDLLAPYDDARVAAALVALAEAKDPSVVGTLAMWLGGMKPGVELPLARTLARAEGNPGVQARALAVLLRSEPDAAEHVQLARRLAEDPTGAAQPALLEAIGDASNAGAADVLTVLRERGPAASRIGATSKWIGRLPVNAEDQALAALAAAPADARFELAYEAAAARRSWVRIALQALQLAVDRPANEGVIRNSALETQWELRPDESAAALLALPRRAPFCDRVAAAIVHLVGHGWVPPAAHDADLLAVLRATGTSGNQVASLLQVLPADAEDRVLALTKDLSNQELWVIAKEAKDEGRPWHRVLAAALARMDEASGLLERNWAGAGPEVVAQLVEMSAASARRNPRHLPNESPVLAQTFVNAFRLSPNLPAALLTPWLATDQGQQALAELSERDPQAALAQFRAQQELPRSLCLQLAYLLYRSGTAEDLPTAVRLARWSDLFQRPEADGLARYLKAQGRGSLEVLRLGAALPRTSSQYRSEVVHAMVNDLRPADFEAALALVPELDREFGSHLLGRLAEIAAPGHGKALIGSVERCRKLPWAEPIRTGQQLPTLSNQDLLVGCVSMLGAISCQEAHPMLRELLKAPEFADTARAPHLAAILAATATAAVQTAGPSRPQFVRELLGSARVEEVAAALATTEAFGPDLRELARAAVLRHAAALDGGTWFAEIEKEQRTALAAAVLDNEAFPRCTETLAMTVLQTLGSHKEARWIPQLARGAVHPSGGVRRAAAVQLGLTFSREAAPHLLELLKDDSENVRLVAQQSLTQIANYLEERAKWEQRLK